MNTAQTAIRGYPRPIVTLGDKKYPQPYTAADRDVAIIDISRNAECINDFLCSVCGLEVTENKCGITVHLDVGEPCISGGDVGLFHLKCAKLTAKLCPMYQETYIIYTLSTRRMKKFMPKDNRTKVLWKTVKNGHERLLKL